MAQSSYKAVQEPRSYLINPLSRGHDGANDITNNWLLIGYVHSAARVSKHIELSSHSGRASLENKGYEE